MKIKEVYFKTNREWWVYCSPFFKKIHYLSGGNGLAAIYVQNSTSTQDSLMYAYTDNQGSVIALTDESGNVIRKYAYDPWGVMCQIWRYWNKSL